MIEDDPRHPNRIPRTPARVSPSRIARALRAGGDAFVRLAEETLGEEIDQRIARIPKHLNEAGVDPFGFDPKTARYVLATTALLYRSYFRVDAQGTENIPDGRVLFIANHSGQVPLDGAMLGTALLLDREPPRFPRAMVERWSAELPFFSVLFPRIGQVVGSPDNARRLLENEEAIVVFPEGSRGISKTFVNRYQLVEFGLGFMRLALETNTPIVPVSIIGAEEQYPSFADIKPLAKLLGMPAFPIVPQAFVGMVLPLPVKYRIRFGEPLSFRGDPDDDDAVIEQKVWVVKQTIQSMLHRGLRERKSVFFG